MCGRVAVIGYPTQVTNQALVHAFGAHDKLMTARRLHSAGIPHPRTAHVTSAEDLPHLEPPVVVKPRFGSWGLDVFRCENATELQRCLLTLEDRSWFRRQGALVQEVVSTGRQDLQLIAAGGHVVGAALRAAAPGEWRTNVSLGGTFAPTVPEAQASRLATAAAAAIGIDLGGVDLVYTDAGSVMVLELNARSARRGGRARPPPARPRSRRRGSQREVIRPAPIDLATVCYKARREAAPCGARFCSRLAAAIGSPGPSFVHSP